MAKAKRPKGQKEPKWIKVKVSAETFSAVKHHLADTNESLQFFVAVCIEERLKKVAA